VAGAGRQTDSQQLFEQQRRSRSDIAAPAIIADGIHTPENMGAVLRLAEAAGSPSVLFIEPEKFDACSPQKIHKAARGAEKTVVWDSCGRDEFFAQPQQTETRTAVELTDTSVSILEASLPAHCVFVIGNERQGISPAMLASCQQSVHIPMYGTNGSMNVTHALAITLFEWRRQQENFDAPSKAIVEAREKRF
jgi:tRNA G18 (ribose-2'-O)-methylase SpoU